MALPTDRGAAGDDSSLENDKSDIFVDAFNEAAGDGNAGTDGTSGEIDTGDVTDDKGKPPGDSVITPTDLGTAGTTAIVDTSSAGTAGTPSAEDLKAEQKYRTLQGIHKADKEKLSAELKARDAEIERLKAAGTAGKSASSDPYSTLTEAEKAELKTYDTEYDQVSKMEGLKRKAELAALKGELTSSIRAEFQEAFDFLLKSIAPALSTTEEISDERHFGTIKGQHPDFEKYRDDGSIEAWIDTKPKYLKDAYTSAYNDGSAQDIVDLITTFKRENGIVAAPENKGADGTAGTAASPAPDIDKQKKKEALSGVHSRKTPASYSQKDKEDYGGAFEEAAKKILS